MDLVIANHQHSRKINLRLLKQITRELLVDLDLEMAEIGICLVGAAEMTSLNETFLKHEGSTDVITFDYADKVAQASRLPRPSKRQPSHSRNGCAALRGDIFICVDEAIRQARKFGTSWQSEIIRYLIHGILHLVGFDDSSKVARRKMKREENRRLREITSRFPLSKL